MEANPNQVLLLDTYTATDWKSRNVKKKIMIINQMFLF